MTVETRSRNSTTVGPFEHCLAAVATARIGNYTVGIAVLCMSFVIAVCVYTDAEWYTDKMVRRYVANGESGKTCTGRVCSSGG
jgi:predicted transporter